MPAPVCLPVCLMQTKVKNDTGGLCHLCLTFSFCRIAFQTKKNWHSQIQWHSGDLSSIFFCLVYFVAFDTKKAADVWCQVTNQVILATGRVLCPVYNSVQPPVCLMVRQDSVLLWRCIEAAPHRTKRTQVWSLRMYMWMTRRFVCKMVLLFCISLWNV